MVMKSIANRQVHESMRGPLNYLLTGLFLAIVLSGGAIAWHHVGNGGDPLRLLVYSAREHAAMMVSRIHPDAFPPGASAEVKAWILSNRDELAADILSSKHSWVTTAEANCAQTTLERAAIIEFSYPTCRHAIASREDAAKLLIHESVHHFGIVDEDTADAVAHLIYRAWSSGILDWQPLSLGGEARSAHSAVWDEAQRRVIMHGGLGSATNLLNTTLSFDPTQNIWRHITLAAGSASPLPRFGHRSVLTNDNRMIVFGGYTDLGSGQWQSSGTILDLAGVRADGTGARWRTIRSNRVDSGYRAIRQSQTIVWAANRLVVWGGATPTSATGRTFVPEGGIYNPDTETWSSISMVNAPLRWSGHSAVWTGREMIVWGGKPLPAASGSSVGETNEGAIWSAASNSWRPMSLTNAPSARTEHSAVWTGEKMIVFGGSDRTGGIRGTGGVYNPATNSWESFASEVATQRVGHTAVWTGDEMLVWGGKTRDALYGSIVAFSPSTGAWRSLAVRSTPEGRDQHTAVWTGMSMIVFGGVGAAGSRLDTGGIFYP